MISFTLRCGEHGHSFDGWFRSTADFERQASAKLVACPVCGSQEVEKALMAPAVSTSRSQDAPSPSRGPSREEPAVSSPPPSAGDDARAAYAKLQTMVRELRSKADYVGSRFAEEARRIHYGEAEERQIYGEASKQDVERLGEEGIGILPLPPLPEDAN